MNISGALALGVIAGVTEERLNMDAILRTALTIGVLGGYTTFSTLMYEAIRQVEVGGASWAAINLAGSMIAGMGAMILGLALGRAAGA